MCVIVLLESEECIILVSLGSLPLAYFLSSALNFHFIWSPLKGTQTLQETRIHADVGFDQQVGQAMIIFSTEAALLSSAFVRAFYCLVFCVIYLLTYGVLFTSELIMFALSPKHGVRRE